MKKFSVRDEIGYTCGDMAGSFVNLFVDAYFLTFCTYILGISAKWMGSLFLVSRLWDAINDPIIGSFPDRWRIGKSGDKFKPYVKIFMLPLALSGVLCFFDVSAFHLGGFALHAWVAFVYILYGMSYTGTSMPYGAMASVITNDPVERTKLSRARSIGGTIVGVGALSFVPILCFDAQNNPVASRFTLLAVVFGIGSLICYMLLMSFCTERIRDDEKKSSAARAEKFNYLDILKSVFRNRPMIGVMVATVGSLLYITGNNQLRTYIFKEYYQNTDAMAILSMGSLVTMAVCFPLVPRLTKLWGKRKLILISSVYSLALFAVMLIVPIQNVYVYAGLNLAASLGQTVFIMLIWAMVTDCLDYGEWITGKRNDGSMYSIYTFSRKIGSTLASTIAAFSLGAIGYVSGTGVVQAPEVVQHIRVLVCTIPVITGILEVIGIGLIFNLDQKKTEQMYQELAARRND
ncbi:MAG: glycoside-pentoside-hexuronide (GPH):cation symporter [Eubacteriales bacterium]|nr:glycoside-pentoside-hexuronide (GPH):cation symporter [Eubacteriales bacterium]